MLCNELLIKNWDVVIFFNMMKLNLMKILRTTLKRQRYVNLFCFVFFFFCLFLLHCFWFPISSSFYKIFNLVLIQFSFSCKTNSGRSFIIRAFPGFFGFLTSFFSCKIFVLMKLLPWFVLFTIAYYLGIFCYWCCACMWY